MGSITCTYELSPAEVTLLEQACRVADLLVRVDAELAAGPLTVLGSEKQPRAHPLLASRAEQTRLLDGLLRSMALPLPDESEGARRSPQQVAAARARWRQQKTGARRGSVA